MKLSLAGLFAIALMVSTAPSPAQGYNITDLGAVAGEKVSAGYGLNVLGQAAGTSSNPNGAIATLFGNGEAINLGTLEPFDVAIARAINGSGQVVGYEFFSSTPNNTPHAWLYSNGTMRDIHSVSLFPAGTYAFGINKSGQVVGQGLVDSSTFHAFLYTGGQMLDIGTLPGGFQASASAINDSGQVAGGSQVAIRISKKTVQYVEHAFLYLNGQMADLGVPSGATDSGANAINANGQIVGFATINGVSHAALHTGVWTDLGVFPGASGTQAYGINLAGQIVGTAFFPTVSYHPFIPGKHVGFIVGNGTLVDLDTLIPSNSGFTITDALAINDSGEILCDAKNTSGYKHAVLLTPK